MSHPSESSEVSPAGLPTALVKVATGAQSKSILLTAVPSEVIQHILSLAIIPSNAESAAALTTCRVFRELGQEYLYSKVNLDTQWGAKAFAAVFEKRPNLMAKVVELKFGGIAWPIVRSEVKEEVFTHLKSATIQLTSLFASDIFGIFGSMFPSTVRWECPEDWKTNEIPLKQIKALSGMMKKVHSLKIPLNSMFAVAALRDPPPAHLSHLLITTSTKPSSYSSIVPLTSPNFLAEYLRGAAQLKTSTLFLSSTGFVDDWRHWTQELQAQNRIKEFKELLPEGTWFRVVDQELSGCSMDEVWEMVQDEEWLEGLDEEWTMPSDLVDTWGPPSPPPFLPTVQPGYY